MPRSLWRVSLFQRKKKENTGRPGEKEILTALEVMEAEIPRLSEKEVGRYAILIDYMDQVMSFSAYPTCGHSPYLSP